MTLKQKKKYITASLKHCDAVGLRNFKTANYCTVGIPKIRKLINKLANSVPFQSNVSKLAGSIEITRKRKYIQLHRKPEKVLLHNPNLVLCPDKELN